MVLIELDYSKKGLAFDDLKDIFKRFMLNGDWHIDIVMSNNIYIKLLDLLIEQAKTVKAPKYATINKNLVFHVFKSYGSNWLVDKLLEDNRIAFCGKEACIITDTGDNVPILDQVAENINKSTLYLLQSKEHGDKNELI